MKKIKTTESKGNGVFAEKSYEKGNIVLIGKIAKELTANNSHASQIGLNRFIMHDEVYRNLNHSCNPNCGIRVNSTGAHNLMARRAIPKGEEITFDYAMENYSINYFPAKCMCGSNQCRENVTGWKGLTEEKKEEYRLWAAPYLFELDTRTDAHPRHTQSE